MDFGLGALGSRYFYAAWAETSSLTTEITALADTLKLVSGKVRGISKLYWFEKVIYVAWATV